MSEKRFHMNFDKYAHQIMCDGDGLSLQETVKILNEQQATINRLEEENEQLRKELNDCEKFRYTVFKRMGELNDERRTKRN